MKTSLALAVLLAIAATDAGAEDAKPWVAGAYSFSDERGGFRITGISGQGTQTDPVVIDVRDPRNRYFGHIDPENMDPAMQTQDKLALSASMRTALLVYSGISVKMMVDSDLGADLSTMFMVQYEPDGFAGPHDHPLEETYMILEGEVEGTFDDAVYRLGPGDVAWAGVGCVHAFRNVTEGGTGRVRWLETQAPQPPGRHSYRFVRDWTYLENALARDDHGQPSPNGQGARHG